MRKDRLGQLEEMTGVTAADAAVAGGATDVATETDVPSEAEDLGARFRDPVVQDAIRNPEELVLESEMYVSDWSCKRCHEVTTTYGYRPHECSRCKGRGFEGPDDRVQDEQYRLTLAFSNHDIRKRKVYERIEHLRATIVSEMTVDNPGATLEREWLGRHPGTERVGMTSPRTTSVAREVLQYFAQCPQELVEGIGINELTRGIRALLGVYADYMTEAVQKKAERTASASAPSMRSSGPTATANGNSTVR